jgi:polysaccharide export outer membrane protein
MVPQPIKAAGLLPGELEAGLVQALVAGKILVNPVVTVTIAEYRSRPVSVVGAVKKPLTFQAFGEVTLLDAIARAEGLTEYAGPELLVTQSEADDKGEPKKLVRRIRVKELIDDANPALNLALHGGEEIRVPEMGKVFVVGSVKKPGVFPVQEASGTSVLKILAYSEGLSPYASKVAYIYRTEAHGSGKNEIRIELSQIIARKAPDATLQANDILYVPDNKGRRTAMNTLEKILLIGTATSGALVYGAVR